MKQKALGTGWLRWALLAALVVFVLPWLLRASPAAGQEKGTSAPAAADAKAGDEKEEKAEPDAKKEETGGKEEAGEEKPKRIEPKELVHVTVGAYVNDVQTIDLKQHSYAVDIYIWFRWKNPDVDPAAAMEFINPSELWGHTSAPNYEEPVELPNGELYQVVRVQGRFSKKLFLYSYPFDRQELTVTFEDSLYESKFLVYEPDKNPVTLNPNLVLPGFEFEEATLDIQNALYPTNFGDVRLTEPGTFSRATIRLPVARPAGTYAIKLILPVLCVFLCAALMFLLRPSLIDARIGIGITSLLTIVALQITTNEDLPDVDYLVLMDKIYIAAYLYVIAGLELVVRTAKMIEDDKPEAIAAAKSLQKKSLVILSTLAAVGVIGLIVSAIATG